MQYFVYGRDRPGSFGLKKSLNAEHWSFMDSYADKLVARGPTLTGDGEEAETTGSLHIVDLPDARAAHAFAREEPYYRAGVFESILLCGFVNVLRRTMWDFSEAVDGYGRFLVLAWGEPGPGPIPPKNTIVYGDLLALEDETHLGRAALLEAPDRETAATSLSTSGEGRTEVHHWRFGGRPGTR
ncbi:YciI family protein [Micromonospora sp. NPDC049523]|uniref:YciI family protein n=1 Tax=Micromonospora sp. NPDC049523 TaxID=3155921 RepID=UPI00342023DD